MRCYSCSAFPGATGARCPGSSYEVDEGVACTVRALSDSTVVYQVIIASLSTWKYESNKINLRYFHAPEAFCDFYYIHFWTMKNGLHVFFWWKMILWHIKQSILVICVISNLPYSLRLQLIHIFNFWCYQTRHWKFTFFIVKLYKKGKKYVPKPPFYSYIKYIDPLDPFGLWKHDLNPFFHLIPPSSVCQEKMCFLFQQGQKFTFQFENEGFL